MIVVIDTNVFISSLIKTDTPPAVLFELWDEQRFQLALSEVILTEFTRVVFYPKVRTHILQSDAFVMERIHDLRKASLLVEGDLIVDVIKADPTDNKFLACAVEAQADLLVSGDEKHILPLHHFQGIPIVTPKDAVEMIQSQAITLAA